MSCGGLFPVQFEDLLRDALREDLGAAGDLTSEAILPAGALATARVVARAPGVVAGLGIATRAFSLLDPALEVKLEVEDGARVEADRALAEVSGSARAILAAERTVLNLLGRLCGIATATAAYVAAVAGTAATIVCTRKTTPGLRALEKYAVRCGGGANHRFGLDDAVLIKDNHLAVAGSVRAAVESARRRVGHLVKIQVEVDDWIQLEEALATGVEAILLDNFEPAQLAEAVRRVGGRATTEASGGITLANVRAVAETGVDRISIGALTHSSPALDVALDVLPLPAAQPR